MNNFLHQIIEKKKKELSIQKAMVTMYELTSSSTVTHNPQAFKKSMHQKNSGDISLIAEIKLASPTIKELGSEKEIERRTLSYIRGGADAISIITERSYFNGNTSFVGRVKKISSVPVLQKDFVIDPYQIIEAKTLGADALLLIAAIVTGVKLQSFVNLTKSVGIEPVVEINTPEDLTNALATNASVFAVNARNLMTFRVDVDKACALLKKIPGSFTKLGFSGIDSYTDVQKYKKAGVNGVLVGTNLMKAKNPTEFIRSLRQ